MNKLKQAEDERWRNLREEGKKIAKKLKITNEDEVDRIIHEVAPPPNFANLSSC